VCKKIFYIYIYMLMESTLVLSRKHYFDAGKFEEERPLGVCEKT
jgi:hypothetical protein